MLAAFSTVFCEWLILEVMRLLPNIALPVVSKLSPGQEAYHFLVGNQDGIGYHIPHINNERRQAEGRLPIALSITTKLVAQTLALIEEREVEKGGE
jgi:hypothetical protein